MVGCVEHVDDGSEGLQVVDCVNTVAVEAVSALDRLVKGEAAE